MLGYTQAFSSLGGVMVSGMAALIAKSSASLPAIYGAHDNWRYLLISGLIPRSRCSSFGLSYPNRQSGWRSEPPGP